MVVSSAASSLRAVPGRSDVRRARAVTGLITKLLFATCTVTVVGTATGTMSGVALAAPTAAAEHVCPFSSAADDLNGDGYGDVAVGDPNLDIGDTMVAGQVIVFFGGPDGTLGSGPRISVTRSTLGQRPDDGDMFGEAVAIGDVTGDSCADLVVGAPGENSRGLDDAGAVHIVSFSPSSASSGDGSQDDAARIGPVTVSSNSTVDQDTVGAGRAEPGDGFGYVVAVAAPQPHEDPTFVVSALLERDDLHFDSGEVDVFRLRATGEPDPGYETTALTGPDITASDQPRHFGAALAFTHLSRSRGTSSPPTLLVGVPGADVHGVAAGLVAGYDLLVNVHSHTWTQSSPGIPGTPEPGDEFGSSFAVLNDADQWWPDMVAVGIPGESIGTIERAGMVQSLTGDGAGHLVPGPALHQNTPGVAGAAEPGDVFGSSVALRSDRHLAVAAAGEDLGDRAFCRMGRDLRPSPRNGGTDSGEHVRRHPGRARLDRAQLLRDVLGRRRWAGQRVTDRGDQRAVQFPRSRPGRSRDRTGPLMGIGTRRHPRFTANEIGYRRQPPLDQCRTTASLMVPERDGVSKRRAVGHLKGCLTRPLDP